MEGSPEPQTFGPSCRSQLRRVVPARFRFRVLHPFLFGCVCVCVSSVVVEVLSGTALYKVCNWV